MARERLKRGNIGWVGEKGRLTLGGRDYWGIGWRERKKGRLQGKEKRGLLRGR